MDTPQKLEGLKQTPYLRLLRYAFDKAATQSTFTKEEACLEADVSPVDFEILKDDICALVPDSTSEYAIVQPALINYLAFVQLEDAHAHAYQANKHALSAIRYARDSLYAAVGAIIISIILGIISLFNSPELDVTQLKELTGSISTAKLDQPQLEELTNAIERSKWNETEIIEIKNRLDAIKIAVESLSDSRKPRPIIATSRAKQP